MSPPDLHPMQTWNRRKHLRSATRAIVVGAIASVLTACVTAAPGADKVRLTKNASDVGNCTAVGNINVPGAARGDVNMLDANNQFRNQVVGLGGNTAFITDDTLGIPVEGIAYRCP
jgi:hypothetical protein